MKVVWFDAETTGLDPHEGGILEVAVVVTDLEHLLEPTGPSLSCVLRLEPAWPMSPFVRDMHTKNGLLGESRESQLMALDVELALLALVPDVPDKNERPILAGSSVHFDRSFLGVWMPTLAARLSHRAIDTRSIQLFCQSLGMPAIPKQEKHRAMPDVLEAIDCARKCAAWVVR